MKKQLWHWELTFWVKVKITDGQSSSPLPIESLLSLFILAVILIIAVAGLGLEYARRAKNDTDKETRQQDRLAYLEKQLSELEIVLTNQSAQMLQLERVLQHQVSPPSLPPSSKKAPPPGSPPAPSAAPAANSKTPVGQSFSIVDTSSMRAPLMQLHPGDLLSFPVKYAMETAKEFLQPSLKQWLPVRPWKN